MRVRTLADREIHRGPYCARGYRACSARGGDARRPRRAPEEVFDAISEQAAGVCGVGAGAVVRFSDAGGTDARERPLEPRVRLVKTADDERRRLERNLHDGAQQRLVSARLALRMLRKQLDDPAPVDAILDELAKAHEELRELARGLHPAVLARGLGAPIGALATRSSVPVEYDVVDERFAEELEIAVYYVAGEALTNAAKHAEASVVRVSVRVVEATLVLEVVDDGRGGAVAGGGSGLVGLGDRVEALRGRLRVTSPVGAGTTVRAEFPLA